jgi:hypothetical protein
MKRIFSLVIFFFASQVFAHGEYFDPQGLGFYTEQGSSEVVLDNKAVTDIRLEISKRQVQLQEMALSGFKVSPIRGGTSPLAKAPEDEGQLPMGQLFVVIDDARLGKVTLPLFPVHAYSSHDHSLGNHASKVSNRDYYSIPRSALRRATSIEIRRVEDDGVKLIRKVDFAS